MVFTIPDIDLGMKGDAAEIPEKMRSRYGVWATGLPCRNSCNFLADQQGISSVDVPLPTGHALQTIPKITLESPLLSYLAMLCNYWSYGGSVACVKKSSRPTRHACDTLLEHARSRCVNPFVVFSV